MAFVLDAFVSSLVGTLVTMGKDEIVRLLGVEGEIELLRWRLERILPVLADADQRSLQDKRIDGWVKQLRDVAYDAEDIIADCNIEANKRKSSQKPYSSSSSSSLSVSRFYCPLSCFNYYGVRGHHISKRIESLNQKLNGITNDMPLLESRSTSTYRHRERHISRETSPLVEPHLVGEKIEEDTKKLVDLLLSQEHRTQTNISVFAITGMGGIGKTTLSQKIYNDDKLRAEFHHPPPIWVCVSKDFSEIDLLKMIIERAGGKVGEAKYKADLEPMLCEIVRNKKLFLVLDDVWDARVWEELLYKPLKDCSVGSKVLVTTRKDSVARSMGAIYYHQVEKLSDEDGWSLLSNMVFHDGEDVAYMQNYLGDVGMSIVKKCDGLPLALKTIAGVLRNKDKKQSEWRKVLKNPAWSFTEDREGVMGALYLSYIELPSNLKQCFLYFSLFPEDDEFYELTFRSLWIAEGFVEAKENMLMEEVAIEYWKELVHRNLLQPNDDFCYDVWCTMHDLLHSLAKHLASDECLYRDKDEVSEKSRSCVSRSTKVRRVRIANSMDAIQDVFTDHGSLRTLFMPGLKILSKEAIIKLKYLRILDIEYLPIDSLPNCIEDLVHLKYLNVSNTAIREIPESIGNLRNLQFLFMWRCKNLCNLPRSITNLSNLRNIYVSETRLQNLPVGIGKLENLVTLVGFLVFSSNRNSNNGNKKLGNWQTEQGGQRNNTRRYCSLEELGSLTQLQRLTIYNLESASDREAARAAALISKNHLIELLLSFSDAENYIDNPEKINKLGEVFEELCPPTCLEEITIEGYFGLKYPSWMMDTLHSFLPNLRVVRLMNCALCEQLPSLGRLIHLESLRIEGASAVTSIGPEFFGFNEANHLSSYFPKLDKLIFRNMPNWVEWSWLREEESQIPILAPRLRHMTLEGCPKLQSLAEGFLHHATSLLIKGAHSLTQVKNLHHLETLGLDDSPSIERISHLPALKFLKLKGCKELKHVEGLDALQYLVLSSRNSSLPKWFHEVVELKLPSLQGLLIKADDVQLLHKCAVGGSYWDKIRHIPQVQAYAGDYGIEYTKSPYSFISNLPHHDHTVNNEEGSGGTAAEISGN